MRCILAPPHHFVVPSPYKQGESAVRINIPQGSCTLYAVSYTLPLLLRNHLRRINLHHCADVMPHDERDDERGKEDGAEDVSYG